MSDASPVLADHALERDLVELVAELAELDPGTVGVDVPFPAIGLDSLLAMEIAVRVEERFGIFFEEADIKEIQTITQMAAAVRARSDPGIRGS